MESNQEKEEKKRIQTDWLELCDYVHKEIFKYSKEMKFPRYMALRLRGLGNGKFMGNNNSMPMAIYEYKTILYTFKICKFKILQYLEANKTKFTNEQHKFNGVMVIIENEINDVVLRLKNINYSNKKLETVELNNQFHEGAEYIKRNKETMNNELKELW